MSALYTPKNYKSHAFLLSSWIINMPFTIVGNNEMQDTLQSIILLYNLTWGYIANLQTYTMYSEIRLTNSAYHWLD